jgi:hypothetical protein
LRTKGILTKVIVLKFRWPVKRSAGSETRAEREEFSSRSNRVGAKSLHRSRNDRSASLGVVDK